MPSSVTTLIGRERDIEEIEALLDQPGVRLLSLTGAPGVGKTRLALGAAARVQGQFADGVFFVSLAGVGEAAQVPAAVAQALRLAPTGRQTLLERVADYLRSRRVLLVLDNFEHVLDAAPHVATLLAAAPRLRCLVTTRAALRLSGEHRYVVPPLAVPPISSGGDTLATCASVELFVERARVAEPRLTLSEANIDAVQEICRRVDGLPLAIELLAACATVFTPKELLARLDERLATGGGAPRDLPERQMTLERAIEWSYRLLSPADQQLFRHLSVFADGTTFAAAQVVCDETDDIVDRISELVGSSLLQRREGADGQSRFDMLETIRAYATRQLETSGEANQVRKRHAAYFLRLAEDAERELDTPREWPLLRQIVAERENVRAALRWGLTVSDAAFVLRLNAALFSYWITCSALPEARDWLIAALELPDPDPLATLARPEGQEENLKPPSELGLARDRAKVLNTAGWVAAFMGEHAQATALFERALDLYQHLGDTRGIAWSMRSRAFARIMRDDYRASEQLLKHSLRLCQDSGDAWGQAWSLYALAFLWLAVGDLERARPALEEALLSLRRERIPFGLFRALLALGETVFAEGDVAQADALYREGLQLAREAPFLTFITIGLDGLAAVAATQRQPQRAARLWGAAEALRERTDERRWRVFERTYDRALSAARAQVPAEDWAAAWNAGRSLTPERALDEALTRAHSSTVNRDITDTEHTVALSGGSST